MKFEAGDLVKFRGAPKPLLGIYKGPCPKSEGRSLIYWISNAMTSSDLTDLLEPAAGEGGR